MSAAGKGPVPPRTQTTRKWVYVIAGAALAAVLIYPVAGNFLLMTGALERIISRKPEKLKIEWSRAWTLLPGRIHVEGFRLDIHSRNRNHIQVVVADAELRMNLLDLVDRTVNIDYIDATGLTFSRVKLHPPGKDAPAGIAPAAGPAAERNAGGAQRAPPQPGKPPWIVQLSNVTASDVQRIRYDWFDVSGRGDLHELAMRLVTKGGPLRIDKLDLDMDVAAAPGSRRAGNPGSTKHLKADIRMAENIPKQNKGIKLLKFVSGRLRFRGGVEDLAILTPILRGRGSMTASGGALDVVVVMESGEVMPGSMISIDPDHFEADFPGFHADGSGGIAAGIHGGHSQAPTLRLDFTGLDLDLRAGDNRVRTVVDQSRIELPVSSLKQRNVHIASAHVNGLDFAYTADGKAGEAASAKKEAGTAQPRPPTPAATGNTPAAEAHELHPPPLTIEVNDTHINNLRSVRFGDFSIAGRGDLREFAMRLVTPGGPLRVDRFKLDMTVLADSDATLDQEGGGERARLSADVRLAEFVPGRNKGKELLKSLSGKMEFKGDAKSIEFINPLLGDKYRLTVSGAGNLDILALVQSGELTDGSRIDFVSDRIETDFLDLHARGAGRIVGRVGKHDKIPVNLRISLTDFRLNHQGATRPYMEGADLFITLEGTRFFLDGAHEDDRLFVNFPHSRISDLTDYNRFIPKHAHVHILGGTGTLNGTMRLSGETGRVNLELTGTDVLLDVNGDKIGTDLKLVANLREGKHGDKSYDLAGTRFRMDDAHLATASERTKSGWWGEIMVDKGDLIWTEPMDIDAQMTIRMRDTEPVIALLRDTNKRTSLLDRVMTVRDLKGTLGIQTNQEDILLDPIVIKGKGLEVISRLNIVEDSMDGAVYVKLRGIPVNFEIKDNKAKFKGLGGKKKVERLVNMESLRRVPH